MIPFIGALVERVVHDFLDIGTPLKQFTDIVLAPPQHPIEREQVDYIKFILILNYFFLSKLLVHCTGREFNPRLWHN